MKKTNGTRLYQFADDEELERFVTFAYKRKLDIRSHFPSPHLVADVANGKEEESGYQMSLFNNGEYILVKKGSRLETAVLDFMRVGVR